MLPNFVDLADRDFTIELSRRRILSHLNSLLDGPNTISSHKGQTDVFYLVGTGASKVDPQFLE